MKIGLAYDLNTAVEARPGGPEDALEEYDPPGTIDALATEIERLGHQVVHLGGGEAFLQQLLKARVDLVFNIAEGRGTYRSREAQLPGILEMLEIPYSGSDPLTLAICLDKPTAKRLALCAGISTPRFRVVHQLAELAGLIDSELQLPVVVKPAFEGSSKGIRLTSKVNSWDDLYAPVQTVLEAYHQPALIEEFIAGTELTVGIVGNCPPRLVAAMEVVPRLVLDGSFMYTLEVKRDWRRQVSYRCPPQLPHEQVEEAKSMALVLFRELGCRDLTRIDFRIDKGGHPYFLEANPLPGLSPVTSDLPIMASLSGWSYGQLIENILEVALERCNLTRTVYAHRARL